MTRSPLVGSVAVLAAPVGPVASAGTQQTPGGAPLSPSICKTSQIPPRALSEAPTQGG